MAGFSLRTRFQVTSSRIDFDGLAPRFLYEFRKIRNSLTAPSIIEFVPLQIISDSESIDRKNDRKWVKSMKAIESG